MVSFNRSIAIVIGINQYQYGIPKLKTASNDAYQLSRVLRADHDYQVNLLQDHAATKEVLCSLLTEKLHSYIGPNSRLLFYFAGHGIAFNGDEGPEGYLIPQDAKLGDSGTYLPMALVHEALTALPCHHFLGIFDCCFAGAFRWSGTRDISFIPDVLYKESYDRFLLDPAWQVITSAADDQKASDSLSLRDYRGESSQHSPFAEALIKALQANSEADVSPPARLGKPAGDGVITATELYQYLRDKVEPSSIDRKLLQTPGLWPLKKHGKGEFVFLVPGRQLDLPAAPPLNEAANPYRGLESFEESHQHLFFGRQQLILELQEFVESHPLTVVLGASGTGKSSLIKAGLLPSIKLDLNLNGQPIWQTLPIIRPGTAPMKALMQGLEANTVGLKFVPDSTESLIESLNLAMEKWQQGNPHQKLLLVVDQAEELFSLCRDREQRQLFLKMLSQILEQQAERFHIVLTLRSDFEPQLRDSGLEVHWSKARFLIRPMNRVELRAAIELPATAKVMYFDPPELVERLIDEVSDMPGALPLLSFTLRELFLKYLRTASTRTDRAITETDYTELGGIKQALVNRANEEYQYLVDKDSNFEATIRHVMLRMVAASGTGNTRRQVLLSELKYPHPESERVQTVIEKFQEARLLVSNTTADNQPYVEPAHDALVEGWPRLLQWLESGVEDNAQNSQKRRKRQLWKRLWILGRGNQVASLDEREKLLLQRRLTPAANDWQREQKTKFLWHADARLSLLKQLYQTESSWFNLAENEFLKHSLGKKRFNVITRWVAVTITFSILISLQQTAQRNAKRALEQRNTAVSRQLASQAATVQSQRTDLLELSSLLAVESIKREPSLEAEQVIRDNLSLLPRLIFKTQDTNPLKKLKLSSDGQYIATIDSNNQVKIRHSADGQEVASTILSENVEVMEFSPDASQLVVSSQTEVIILDSESLNIIRKLEHRFNEQSNYLSQNIYKMLFSPSKRYLATVSHQGAVIWDFDKGEKVTTIQPAYGGVGDIAFSPNEKLLATGSAESAVLDIWSLGGQNLKTIRIDLLRRSSVNSVAFSQDSQYVAAGTYFGPPAGAGTAAVFNVLTGDKVISTDYPASVTSIVFKEVQGKDYLAAGSIDGTAKVIDFSEKRVIASFEHDGIVKAVDFVVEHNHLLTVSERNTVQYWDIETGQEMIRTSFGKNIKSDQAFSEGPFGGVFDISVNASLIANINTFGGLSIWNINNQKDTISTPKEEFGTVVRDIEFSPQGDFIAATSGLFQRYNNRVRVWNTSSMEQVFSYTSADIQPLENVLFTDDQQYLIVRTASNVKALNFFVQEESSDAADINESYRSRIATENRYLNVSLDGKYIVENKKDTADFSDSSDIAVIDILSGQQILEIKDFQENIGIVEFSQNSKYVAVSNTQMLQIYKMPNEKVLSLQYENLASAISSPVVKFTPDEKFLVVRKANAIEIWEISSGEKHLEITYENDENYPFAFGIPALSPDSRYIAVGPSEEYRNSLVDNPDNIEIWDISSKKLQSSITHRGDVSDVDWSPDGKYVVTGSFDNSVKVWDVQQDLKVLEVNHEDSVTATDFSDDGKFLATGGLDNTVRVWNLDSRREVARLRNDNGVGFVKFSPNGRQLAIASPNIQNDSIVLWSWWLEDLSSEICSRLTRNMSQEEWNRFIVDEPYQRTCPKLPIPDEQE